MVNQSIPNKTEHCISFHVQHLEKGAYCCFNQLKNMRLYGKLQTVHDDYL